MQRPHMRRAVSIATAAVLCASLAACNAFHDQASGPVKVGLLTSLSGAYAEPAQDIRDAFELYIESNGGKLGGREVDISVRDEGVDAKAASAVTEKLTSEDEVDVLAGGMSSIAYVPEVYEATSSKRPFISMGGQGKVEESKVDRSLIWHTAVDPTQSGVAIAPYIEDNVDGEVYAIGPGYEGGHAVVESFTKPFKEHGGELANPDGEPAWTQWPAPKTSDFSEYLDEAVQTDAKAIFAYYSGKPSIDFVKQWSESAASEIPLYGTYLTEGAALAAQGEAALGVRNSQNYSPVIDNAPNRTFVSEWSSKNDGAQPDGFSLIGWDTALLLDKAVSAIPADQKATPDKIADAISKVGTVDSPRGEWQFNERTHLPVQKWYLTVVAKDGPTLSPVVLQDLATLGY